jgi:hypothetical protein
MMTSTLIKELLNEAHNHLQDVRFYAEARELELCNESIAKVYGLHEQIDKLLGDNHEADSAR